VSRMRETAEHFFVACETGEGWDGCNAYCHPDASFSAQSAALAEVATVEAYTNWMSGVLGIISDGEYELRSFAEDADRDSMSAYAVFRGTPHRRAGQLPRRARRSRATTST
jgi:hypothetical protein